MERISPDPDTLLGVVFGVDGDDLAAGADDDVVDVCAVLTDGDTVKNEPSGREGVENSGDLQFSDDAGVPTPRMTRNAHRKVPAGTAHLLPQPRDERLCWHPPPEIRGSEPTAANVVVHWTCIADSSAPEDSSATTMAEKEPPAQHIRRRRAALTVR